MASRAEALASDKPRCRLGPARGSTPPPTVYDDPVADDALPVARDGSPGEMALETWWTFWGRGHRPAERGASRAAAWESEKLHAVKTVEAFWRLHGALQPPSSLASGATYQLFRGDVEPTWRLRERMKTVSVALVLCLNIGTDPPDAVAASPRARRECWLEPFAGPSRQKALETIGAALQAQ